MRSATGTGYKAQAIQDAIGTGSCICAKANEGGIWREKRTSRKVHEELKAQQKKNAQRGYREKGKVNNGNGWYKR